VRLVEIKALLDGDSTDELRWIAERRLPEIDALLERATVVRGWLGAAARCECPSLDDCCLFDGDALRAAPPRVSIR
jgi:MerR family transcriptional regulator, redox-sensitive transcriptional activator SoxR